MSMLNPPFRVPQPLRKGSFYKSTYPNVFIVPRSGDDLWRVVKKMTLEKSCSAGLFLEREGGVKKICLAY